MNIICARSPYTISINQSNQVSSKVELFIYNNGSSVPTLPTYTLAEPIPSVTQRETTYNISNFILEFISQETMSQSSTPVTANNKHWCLCVVKRYATVGTTETLLTTTTYVGLNAYTDPINSANYDISQTEDYVMLVSATNKVYRYTGAIPNYNFIVTRNATLPYVARYYNSSNTLIYTNTFLTAGATQIYNFVIPLYYTTSVRVDICLSTTVLYSYNTELIEECKYTPVTCSFVNRYGGWQQLMFFKAQTNSIAIKGSEYNLLQQSYNYNPTIGQRKSFNINGVKTIKCNTGFIDEAYNLVIQELLMSDRVLLDGIPVNLKTQTLTYKTHLKDKNINFEVEFDYANNALNDII
jgi:hypothetical protein